MNRLPPEYGPRRSYFGADALPAGIDDLPPPKLRVQVAGRSLQALETARARLVVTTLVVMLVFVAVGVRLVDIGMLRTGHEPRLANATPAEMLHVGRADILDRNGELLATSLPVASLYADPALVIDPVEAADRLLTVLPDLDRNRLIEQLYSPRRHIWIRRGLTPRQHQEVHRLGIPGLDFRIEQRRIYPAGALTAHIVGYAGVDGQGLAGIEQRFDEQLRQGAEPVVLSLDLRLQQIVRDELQLAIDEFDAIGGAAMVMDIRSAELLAMISLPDFNPYNPAGASEEARFNRNTLGVYEMGSTYKIFSTATALDVGTATLRDGYDASRPIQVGRFTINDFRGQNRWLSVPEIFLHSSNIGTVRMIQEVGSRRQQEYLRGFGFFDPPTLELPEIGRPMLPTTWRDINGMTISYGYGMAISPVQLVAATAAAVNGGELRQPTLLRRAEGASVPGTRVISEQTSADMRRLMRLVVANGTGRNADAEGYFVGGKTGTAQKTQGRTYSDNARISSFVAAFPMHDPRYAVLVMLDEPQGTRRTHGFATAGWVAAPTVSRIVSRLGPLYGIAPVDTTSVELRDAFHVDLTPRGSQLAAIQSQ